MDLSRHMTRIKEIDTERNVARVRPGVVQEQLNVAAARHGLVFGPPPPPLQQDKKTEITA